MSGLFVFCAGLLLGIGAYVAALRVANGRLDGHTVSTWFPTGEEQPEAGDLRG